MSEKDLWAESAIPARHKGARPFGHARPRLRLSVTCQHLHAETMGPFRADLSFSGPRCLNVRSKKASKFREWLDCSSMEVKPNAVSMEILSYLAYETVAQLVDLALLVKQDVTQKTGDPFSQAISASFIQYHSSTTEVHLLGQASAVKRDPDSPENTPPSTPGVPLAPAHQSKLHSLAQGNGGLGQDGGKFKQRKRKKSAAASSIETQSSAIQPAHIREAIRRYSQKSSPLSPFSVRNYSSKEQPPVPLLRTITVRPSKDTSLPVSTLLSPFRV
ncbi:hypothetical protein JZ751_003630 [Albula glossodonta]|uniref:Uncharacterized protein n=1 Tax=Albula glossodonta TaxID=121402 RepID=A0A8T2NDI7_9TELE|nr:hypothetical protein JZ751_003630 [Albula glossodonta]